MRFLTQPLSGMQRYAEELIAALDVRLAADPGHLGGRRVIGLMPRSTARARTWQAIETRVVGQLGGHAWEQSELGLAARNGTLVSLSGSGPLFHPDHVFAVHDANLFVNPHFYSRSYRMLHGLIRPRLMRRARALVTISDFSRREIARSCGLSEDRFTIVPDSAEHLLGIPPEPEILQRYKLTPGRYVLCVGNQSPNKNIALAIEAFSRLAPEGVRLAVAGGAAAALARTRTVQAPWLSSLGRISDGALRTLYENALLFVFPSIYEGFGVPPLEAMALGCPVVSSDSSAMPEVLGDAALYFRSGKVNDCAKRIAEMLALDPINRQRRVDAGRIRAGEFRWDHSAERLVALLRRLDAN